MTMTTLARQITGGVDTHLDVHVAAALDEHGALLGVESFATNARGYAELLLWLQNFGTVGLVGATVDIQAGAVVSRVICRDDRMEVTVFGFNAGEGLSEHRASRDTMVQMMKGQLEFITDGEHFTAEPGFWFHMDPGTPHSLSAREPTGHASHSCRTCVGLSRTSLDCLRTRRRGPIVMGQLVKRPTRSLPTQTRTTVPTNSALRRLGAAPSSRRARD